MTEPQVKRVKRDLTAAEKDRLQQHRQQVAEELPDMVARDQLRKEAREEATLSGSLRRAIHRSDASLTTIADRVKIPLVVLDEFLTGERTLRSDVMDRLANVLEFELGPTR